MTNGRDICQASVQFRDVNRAHYRDTARHGETQGDTVGRNDTSKKVLTKQSVGASGPRGAVGATPSVRIFRANQYGLRNLVTTSRLSVGGEEFPYLIETILETTSWGQAECSLRKTWVGREEFFPQIESFIFTDDTSTCVA
jgi:hypothetical protein